jgi:hypothetical protein
MDIIMTDEMGAKFREFYNNSSHNIPIQLLPLRTKPTQSGRSSFY